MKHPLRVRLVILLILLLAVLGVRAVAAQGATVRQAARDARELRIIVSIAERRLYVVRDSADTLLAAPVAVGSGKTMRFRGRTWSFNTPRGIRTVVAKEVDPVWIRPDWGYIEVARQHHLRIDSLSFTQPRRLSDGSALVVRGRDVGVVRDSVFEACASADEIVFDGTLFIPPFGTENRSVRAVLGKYRLDLGDGIGIHGTLDHASIGRAATHGCLRLGDEDLAWLFASIPIGTRVYIY